MYELAWRKELKAAYREVKAKVPIEMALNHGVQLSFYFRDPEGHRLEIYWLTPLRNLSVGLADPIDLDLPEEELRREVERPPALAFTLYCPVERDRYIVDAGID